MWERIVRSQTAIDFGRVEDIPRTQDSLMFDDHDFDGHFLIRRMNYALGGQTEVTCQ